MGLLYFFLREKLQFLRNIAYIRLRKDAAAVWLARHGHRHNLIEVSTTLKRTWKVSCGPHSPKCFSCVELLSFRAVNSIYSLNDFISVYVCYSWMCFSCWRVFSSLNVEVCGVSDYLGERIHIFSVGNVELIFKNWFTLSRPRPSTSWVDPCMKFGKQECGLLWYHGIILNPR